jgi:hypothetical protein
MGLSEGFLSGIKKVGKVLNLSGLDRATGKEERSGRAGRPGWGFEVGVGGRRIGRDMTSDRAKASARGDTRRGRGSWHKQR